MGVPPIVGQRRRRKYIPKFKGFQIIQFNIYYVLNTFTHVKQSKIEHFLKIKCHNYKSTKKIKLGTSNRLTSIC